MCACQSSTIIIIIIKSLFNQELKIKDLKKSSKTC